MSANINDKLKTLPDNPGVYQFKNDSGKIIYVGKAKNLKNRVRSYFQKNVTSPKTSALVKKISDIEIIVTDSEIEALVLESNLIKEYKPRYNINLKDDKSFPYIRITNEMFPQIFPTRRIIKDGSKYFGPYTEVKSMKSSLKMINQIFKIRSCKYTIDNETIEKKKVKVCLDFHIKKCDGPCEGLISEKDYKQMVGQVTKLLQGKTDELIDEMKNEMNSFVAKMMYERAAEVRDRIEALAAFSEKHKVVSDDNLDRDIIAVAYESKDASCTIFNIRQGKLIGKKQLRLNIEGNEQLNEIYSSIIKQYYTELTEIPLEIIIEVNLEDEELITRWLEKESGHKVKIFVPKKESKLKSLFKLCRENAVYQLKEIQIQKMKKEGNVPYTLSALQRDLRLQKLPKKIECFDISNLQGTDTVASMVVFVDAKPKKSLYRKYHIKTVSGPDDFASMEEVVERRYKKLIETNEQLPDLIMIDGGKGQLSSAVYALNRIGIKNVSIIGLAKRLEEIFLPGESEPVIIPKTSSSLRLLQHIRDEAHRFAITFHRLTRSKRTITSELTNIKGIGVKLAERLLKEFGSVDKIKSLSINELEKSIGKSKAEKIFKYFNENELD